MRWPFGVATWKFEVVIWPVGFEVATSFLRSRHGWQCGRSRLGFWRRDLGITLWTGTKSRHEVDVAT